MIATLLAYLVAIIFIISIAGYLSVFIIWGAAVYYNTDLYIFLSFISILFLSFIQPIPFIRRGILWLLFWAQFYYIYKIESYEFIYIPLVNLAGCYTLFSCSFLRDFYYYFEKKYEISLQEAKDQVLAEDLTKLVINSSVNYLVGKMTFAGFGFLFLGPFKKELYKELDFMFNSNDIRQSIKLADAVTEKVMINLFIVNLLYIICLITYRIQTNAEDYLPKSFLEEISPLNFIEDLLPLIRTYINHIT